VYLFKVPLGFPTAYVLKIDATVYTLLYFALIIHHLTSVICELNGPGSSKISLFIDGSDTVFSPLNHST
jgi:hypothetical protein